MGEPAPWPPPPPTGAPILLALLSLVGSGAPGDGGPIYFQRDLPSGEPQREGYSPVPLQPLALVLWDAAQQRPKAELAQDVSLFTRPSSAKRLERGWSGHRILKPATLPAKIRGFCRNHRAQDFERLFRRREQKKISERQPLSRHRRAFPWPGRLPSLRKGLGGKRDLVTLTHAHATVAPSLLVVKKDIPEPSRPGGEGHLTTAPHSGHQASLPALSTEDGTAHATGCLCPSRDLQKAQGQLGKDVKGPQRVGPRVPTPRTEEAAWAASALAFLLAVLTLSVLYTRLHRKCRRGRSLYWATADEEGHDTVAAVLKRRLLSVQGRRKKWPRRIQQRPLLSATSSDSSE